MATPLAKKAAGTHVEDSPAPAQAVLAWFRQECRDGQFKPLVESFCREQAEPLEPGLTQIDAVRPECIQGHIPCRVSDHESERTFLTAVGFELNPTTGQISRFGIAL